MEHGDGNKIIFNRPLYIVKYIHGYIGIITHDLEFINTIS